MHTKSKGQEYYLFSNARTEYIEGNGFGGRDAYYIDQGAYAFCGRFDTLEAAMSAGHHLFKTEHHFEWAHIAQMGQTTFSIVAWWDDTSNTEADVQENSIIETATYSWGWQMNGGNFVPMGHSNRRRVITYEERTTTSRIPREGKWEDVIPADADEDGA